ncbi:hypothetical protein ACHAXA_001736 [Cyclostephanos tholiformis]|uniref:UBC core domain-containing protein n=1 Tax=Cyclostephanos tholiformis TaxID=382380 RepID=A0ABD3SCV7_9STRA
MITPSPTRPSSRRTGPTPSSAAKERAMRDYKLSIEYKHLKQNCPGGIYLVPSFDDIRHFHGAIFVRRGIFMNGIFKFTLICPPMYNDVGSHPVIRFTSYIYNPHVHPDTGEVDLKSAFPEWDPSRHFLVTALTYVKRIFYVKDYEGLSDEERLRLPNQEAFRLFQSDHDGYRRRVLECVKESQKSVYLNEPGCTMKITKEDSKHDAMRAMMKERFCGGDYDASNEGDASGKVTQEDMLDIIERIVLDDESRG